jgi:UDP-N-acetylglucosamine 1-carboxyvinyltransferase
MEKLVIRGGTKLKGTVIVEGAKNAALPIIAATLLCKSISIIENIPEVEDVHVLLDAMIELGVKVKKTKPNTLEIDTRSIIKNIVDYEDITRIRASYYLLGSLLGRNNEAQVPLPGGCSIGTRPIDQHIKGFEALGAKVNIEHGMIKAKTKKLKASNIYLDVASVGATINVMFAAVLAEGHTVIENPAKEPHIVDVANFLNSMGADVKGAGTDIIKINGVKELHGAEYMIIPDQIEAGTYMIAAAITGGDVTVENLIPKHMEAISAKLKEMGILVEEFDESIRVHIKEPLKNTHVKTLPYPGFPTDMQPQVTALLAITDGTSIMTEGVFENRFLYTDELNRMGANIKVEGNSAIITGVSRLSGAEVTATDLRAGAALVLAGLAAEGETIVNHVDYIDRGYVRMEDKLKALGADIFRVPSEAHQAKLHIV